jgi:hypothetical protein
VKKDAPTSRRAFGKSQTKIKIPAFDQECNQGTMVQSLQRAYSSTGRPTCGERHAALNLTVPGGLVTSILWALVRSL